MIIVEYKIHPEKIVFSDTYPDNDTMYVSEHLPYVYLSADELPTVTCVELDGALCAVRNHKFLRLAQQQGFEWVKVVLLGEKPSFIESIAIEEKRIEELETQPSLVGRYFVFFFTGELDQRGRRDFELLIESLFKNPASVEFFLEGRAAKFFGKVHVDDYSWASGVHSEMCSFESGGIRVLSQDGLKLHEE